MCNLLLRGSMMRYAYSFTIVFIIFALTGCVVRYYGQSTNNDGDGRESICQTYNILFEDVEPLPEGTHPPGLVTDAGHVIRCEGEGQPVLHHKRFPDGTAEVIHSEYADLPIILFHTECGASPNYPEVQSRWVVIEDEDPPLICDWFDNTPGIIFCSDILELGETYSQTPLDNVRPWNDGEEIIDAPVNPNAFDCKLIPEE